jgi:hypothetical protein
LPFPLSSFAPPPKSDRPRFFGVLVEAVEV